MIWRLSGLAAALLLAQAPAGAEAQELDLPSQLAWTAYDTGSAG
jgi:hypothetical protein